MAVKYWNKHTSVHKYQKEQIRKEETGLDWWFAADSQSAAHWELAPSSSPLPRLTVSLNQDPASFHLVAHSKPAHPVWLWPALWLRVFLNASIHSRAQSVHYLTRRLSRRQVPLLHCRQRKQPLSGLVLLHFCHNSLPFLKTPTSFHN